MESIRDWTLPLVVGVLLGGLYYAGLWWTVKSLSRFRRPGLVLTVSFLVRACLLVGGFLLLAGRSPYALFAALIGFTISRFLVVGRSVKCEA